MHDNGFVYCAVSERSSLASATLNVRSELHLIGFFTIQSIPD